MERLPKEIISDSSEAIKLYVDNEIETLKLKLSKKLVTYISGAAKYLILVIIVGIAAAFGAFGITLAWGKHLGSYALAFTYMALIFLMIALLVYLLSSKIITRPILKKVVKEVFDND